MLEYLEIFIRDSSNICTNENIDNEVWNYEMILLAIYTKRITVIPYISPIDSSTHCCTP
jgi:hypothetical protein